MEKRPVDIASRDDTVVFFVLLVGIFVISAAVLAIILVVTASGRVHP